MGVKKFDNLENSPRASRTLLTTVLECRTDGTNSDMANISRIMNKMIIFTTAFTNHGWECSETWQMFGNFHVKVLEGSD